MIEVRARDPVPAAPGYILHGAELRSGDEDRELRVMTPQDARPLSSDWLVPLALTYGMQRNEPVRIDGTVSPMIMGSLDRIQAMMVENAQPHRPLHRIELEASNVAAVAPSRDAGTTCAFSAGLDAFHTALENESEIDALLYVHGFEAASSDRAQLFLLLPHIKAAARDLGKPLFLVDSDHWELIWRGGGRTDDSGVAMLVMVGLLMGSRVRRLLLAASYPQEHEDSHWASLSAFIPLWQTEHLQVEQHGTVSRAEKMEVVAQSDVAMEHLRVCWSRKGTTYNCGRCWKCVRTLINMELAGVTGRCSTLPRSLDLQRVIDVIPEARGRAVLLQDNLRQAEAQGKLELAAAMREGASKEPRTHPAWTRPFRRLRKVVRDAPKRRRRKQTRRALQEHLRATGGEHLFVSVPAADPAGGLPSR